MASIQATNSWFMRVEQSSVRSFYTQQNNDHLVSKLRLPAAVEIELPWNYYRSHYFTCMLTPPNNLAHSRHLLHHISAQIRKLLCVIDCSRVLPGLVHMLLFFSCMKIILLKYSTVYMIHCTVCTHLVYFCMHGDCAASSARDPVVWFF
jgi:hypothetical protein